MFFRAHRPGPPLAGFVEMLWYAERGPQAHALERVLPDGSMGLIINLRDDAIAGYDPRDGVRRNVHRGAILTGARSAACVIDTACQERVMGVVFTPGGAAAFLPAPADEMREIDVDLDLLWGASARELRDRLVDASTTAARFRVLESALLARLPPVPRIHPAVTFAVQALRASGGVRVHDVVEQTGYSARRFIELFRAEVGLTPKLYARVQRFRRVLRTLFPAPDVDLAGLALDAGYFDQAHFTHDFRAFAGMTPTEYVARRGPHESHVAIEEK